jgi:hypothetical protein
MKPMSDDTPFARGAMERVKRSMRPASENAWRQFAIGYLSHTDRMVRLCLYLRETLPFLMLTG